LPSRNIIDTIKDILYDLKEPDLIPLWKQYVLKDRIFYDKNGKIYVPEDQALRLDILKLHHDTPIAGHPVLQTHINFPRFLPIFPGFLERLSHLAPIY
jgi:hypothetical protein